MKRTTKQRVKKRPVVEILKSLLTVMRIMFATKDFPIMKSGVTAKSIKDELAKQQLRPAYMDAMIKCGLLQLVDSGLHSGAKLQPDEWLYKYAGVNEPTADDAICAYKQIGGTSARKLRKGGKIAKDVQEFFKGVDKFGERFEAEKRTETIKETPGAQRLLESSTRDMASGAPQTTKPDDELTDDEKQALNKSFEALGKAVGEMERMIEHRQKIREQKTTQMANTIPVQIDLKLKLSIEIDKVNTNN